MARLGYKVFGTLTQGLCFSHYLDSKLKLPHQELASAVLEEHAQQAFDFILPTSTNASWHLQQACQQHESFPPVFGFSLSTFEQLNDKLLVCQAAERCGVQAPRTLALEVGEEQTSKLEERVEDFPFPAVLKMRDDKGTYRGPEERYCIVKEQSQLSSALQKFERGEALLLQEYIQGQGAAVGLLLDEHGQTQAQIAYRRIREYPLSGGPSSCAESFYDATLLTAAKRLLQHFNARSGFAHVEFKLSARGPVIMEINPRPWGTIRLAEYSGQSFFRALAALYDHPSTKGFERSESFCSGTRVRFLPNDLRGAIKALQKKDIKHFGKVCLDLCKPSVKPLVFAFDDLRGSLGQTLSHFPLFQSKPNKEG